jgi:hypothetical protein
MPMDIRILASKANKTSEDLAKLRQYETARDAAISRSLAETDNVLASVEAKLGVPQTASRAAPSVDTTGFRLTGVRNR